MNTAYTTQTGIRSVSKTYDDVDLFQGMIKLDNGNLAQYDVMKGGWGVFYWTSMPTFMELGNKNLCDRFRNYTEKACTSFDGIQDMQATTEDVTGGFNGLTYKQMTNLKDDFDTFTIKVYEQQGSVVREGLEYWLSGIMDPRYGVGNYHGLVDTIDGGWSAKNHTAEAIYIVTDPTMRSTGIEYACFLTNIMPTKVPKSHLNMTHGDHPVVQYDLEFTATKYESVWINEQAKIILDKRRQIQHYLDYKPKANSIG